MRPVVQYIVNYLTCVAIYRKRIRGTAVIQLTKNYLVTKILSRDNKMPDKQYKRTLALHIH